MNNLLNKVVWITGASSGFGEALTYELAGKGARLIISARREDELERVKSSLPSCEILPLDLNRSDTFADVVSKAIAIYGHVDVMIHNGAVWQKGSVLETPVDKHRQLMEINYFSYYELTRLMLPHFLERGGGHFVVTSGVLGKLAFPEKSAYCAAKFALNGFFDSLRGEVAGDNIHVTILYPGAMKTHFVNKNIVENGKKAKKPKLPGHGCSVEKAARQSVRAIEEQVFEAYVGNTDKRRMLILLSRFLPVAAKKIVIRQSR